MAFPWLNTYKPKALGMVNTPEAISKRHKASLGESEAISTVRRIEIATAICCGFAMTTGEIHGFKSERSRTKNRLTENLVTPKICLEIENS